MSQPPLNTLLRLKGDPNRIGVYTGKQRPGHPERGDRFQIKFSDGATYVYGDQIEPLPADREDPVDLMQSGKLGKASDLRRTLTHVRLTGRLADVIYSMETTNTDFYPYQFKPVLRFLNSPPQALLIADEVGLGKTIEAGLIWTELRSRYDLRRLLVLCPAMLREKWQRELQHKIGVRADIVNPDELLKRMQDPDADVHGYAMICSQEGARPNRHWSDSSRGKKGPSEKLASFLRSNEHQEPLIDLLVIDEAHYLRNPESQTNEMGQLFRPVTANLVILTATPIHNYNQDLLSLLQLLDGDTFEREEDLRVILEASQPLVKARELVLRENPERDHLIELIKSAGSHELLRGSRQLSATLDLLRDKDELDCRKTRAEIARRLETINPLAYVITRTRKRDVKEWRVVREPIREAIEMTPTEAAFYERVTEAVIDYAGQNDTPRGFITVTPQRQMSSCMAASLSAWQKRRDNASEDQQLQSDSGENPLGPLTQFLIDQVDDLGNLDDLMRHDSKYNRLEAELLKYFKAHPDEKVVLFATFRETLNYLGTRLGAAGINNLVMHGGVKKSKDEILETFQADPAVRILLSSEMGSEGIDLQFCRLLVNYDLPWNPMRVEQRIGRLDRLGQAADKIVIWNMFYADTIDDRIYTRLYEKLKIASTALGDFEEVLGDKVRKLTAELLSGHLNEEQQNLRIDQTAQAIENLGKEQENLEAEAAGLVAYGDYILNQIHAAKDLNRRISGEDLRSYMIDFYRGQYPGCDFHQTDIGSMDYDITLSPAAKQDLDDFIRENKLAVRSRLTQNTNRPIRCRFENRTTTAQARDVELISQFHPAIRFVSESITGSDKQLTPAISAVLPRQAIENAHLDPGVYLLAAARWSVKGLRTTERLMFAACPLDEPGQMLDADHAELLANAVAAQGSDWFSCKNDIDVEEASRVLDEVLFASLHGEYEAYVDDVRRQNEDRADLQERNAKRHLDNQRQLFERIRDEHLVRGRSSLARATEGRIHKLEASVERQLHATEKRRKIEYHSEQIFAAAVRIES